MAALGGTSHDSYYFSQLGSLPQELSWTNPPPETILETEGLKVLDLLAVLLFNSNITIPQVVPAGKTDFWQKTFYDPPIEKSDGHALLRELPAGLTQWTAQTQFTLKPINQFDQAGIIVFVDNCHWLKAGIENVDGQPKMSCVVTNGCSDWSTQPWNSAEHVWMRVSYTQKEFIVECKLGERWEFIRKTPQMFQSATAVRVGIYCCAPTGAGMHTTFHSLEISSDNL